MLFRSTVMEIADSLLELKKSGLKADEIAVKTGKSKRSIYKYLQIANLSNSIKEEIRKAGLSINEIENKFLNNKPQERVYSKAFIKKTKHTFQINLQKVKSKNHYAEAVKEVELLLKELKSVMHDTNNKEVKRG